MSKLKDFLERIEEEKLSFVEKSRAILWFCSLENKIIGMSTKDICKVIEVDLGYARQNESRFNKKLAVEKKSFVRVAGTKLWKLQPQIKKELDVVYGLILNLPKKHNVTSSVLPQNVFLGTRGYIEKVVFQINASYDYGLYDCCAVMCRRLLETLLIELYESVLRTDFIKDRDGNFFMFAELLRIFEGDTIFSMSRNGKKGLSDFKKLGDLSAHSRRFNATKDDIDRVRDGLRVASEELLHMSKLI